MVQLIKTLDKYLLSQFLKVLTGSMAFMLGLYLITIYLDNMRYFYHPNVPLDIVLSYIVNLIPGILIQVLPAAALFSTSYIFGNMNSTNEIIALYNGRIGFARLLSPLMISGVILTVVSFLFFEFVSAESTNKAFEIKNNIKKLTGKSLSYMYSNSKCFLKGQDDTVYYVDVFESDNGAMYGPVIFKFNPNGDMIFQLTAASGIYGEKDRTWIFSDAHIIHYNGKEKYSEEKKQAYSMKLGESPRSFMKTPVELMQMRIKDAINFIEAKRQAGLDYKKYLVEFQWRFAFPFSVVITILIGSVSGIYFRKAVLVLSFFLAIILSFGYYGILAIGVAFGKSGKLNPVVAAWLANAIYLTAGIAALKLKK